MDPQTRLVYEFQTFVNELTTVEKRNIVALTEIARDSLKTHPTAVPSLAAVISNRVLQVRLQHPDARFALGVLLPPAAIMKRLCAF